MYTVDGLIHIFFVYKDTVLYGIFPLHTGHASAAIVRAEINEIGAVANACLL